MTTSPDEHAVDGWAGVLSALGSLADDARGCGLAATAIVRTTERQTRLAVDLASRGSMGVEVCTYDHFVSGLWDVYGDGRPLVSAAERRMLLRPLLVDAGLVDQNPSARLVDMAARFVEDAVGVVGHTSPSGEGSGAAGSADEPVLDLVERYVRALDACGRIEYATAELLLARLPPDLSLSPRLVVVVDPPVSCVHETRFLSRLASAMPVHILHTIPPALIPGTARCEASAAPDISAAPGTSGTPDTPDPDAPRRPTELDELRARLFTGEGGLEPRGGVLVGECHGAHVAGGLVARMIDDIHSRGVPHSRIAVVARGMCGGIPCLADDLAAAHIPFEASFDVTLADTALGAALVNLARLSPRPASRNAPAPAAGASAAAPPDAPALDPSAPALDPTDPGTPDPDALCALVLDVHSGLHPADGRALEARWRGMPGVDGAAMLADVRDGFLAARANARMVRERLEPLARLIDADDAARVRMLLANGHAAGLDDAALADDRAAADAAIAFLDRADALGICVGPDDLACVPVTLHRSSGPAGTGVRIVTAERLADAGADWTVLGNLSADAFPASTPPDAFADLRQRLGISAPDATADDARRLLVDAIEGSAQGFAFWRARHEPDGIESRQSALFDELLAVYRTPADDDAGLPTSEIPTSLRPHAVTLSEASLFAASGDAGVSQDDAGAFLDDAGVSQDDAGAFLDDGGTFAVDRGVLHGAAGIAALPLRRGETREFSPTQLEDYHRCPYLWFVNRRVGATPLDRTFDASALGVLFHDAMARFYLLLADAGHPRVTPDNLDAALEIAGRAFDDQCVESAANPKKGLVVQSESDRLELDSLRRQMLDFVRRDADFLPGFAPRYFEVALVGGESPLEFATVPVRGAVDRIDVDGSGRAVVIDYKLSGLSVGYGLPADAGPNDVGTHLQADIYATLVEKHFAMLDRPLEVVGSVYRSYSKNMLRGVYASDVNFGPTEKVRRSCDALDAGGAYRAYLARVEEVVTAEMRRLAAGDIAPDPADDAACTYCRARTFCPRAGRRKAHGGR